MVKTVTPFSSRAKEGATDSPLGDFVEVPQTITSTASAGFYDENGKLTGNSSTDRQWRGFDLHESIPNGQAVLVPAGTTADNPDHVNMAGFKSIFIAIKPSSGGNVIIEAKMGPDTNTFAGLEPVNSAATLRGAGGGIRGPADRLDDLFVDSSDSLTADVWNIFYIKDNLAEQRNMQFKITNNSGSTGNIEFAYLRLV
tara:strand:- start:413 stop:1006 length:594 start_codon:yes stop_codon:yes gene_type:complete